MAARGAPPVGSDCGDGSASGRSSENRAAPSLVRATRSSIDADVEGRLARHAAELSRKKLNELGVAKSVKAPVSLSVILPLDAASWKNVPGGIAKLKGSTNVPIDDVRSFLETGKFRDKTTDPLHAMLRKGMVKTDKDRRAKVKAYAEAFVMKRRESKNVFPIKPEKVSKPIATGGTGLSKIVSLEEALERAKPRSAAKGSRKRTAASKEKSAAKRAKKPAAAPPAKEPYSPSFP